MSASAAEEAEIRIDFEKMAAIISVAVRRVSAFIRLGLDRLDERTGIDFDLTSSVNYRWWPPNIDPDVHTEVREEYRAWLIGSCLRELDLFYGLFLDRIWFAVEVLEHHSASTLGRAKFDTKFTKDTNVANKQKRVSAKLGVADQYQRFNSLSLARNALAHNAGIIRASDCNDDSRARLVISWAAFEMTARRAGEERVVERSPFDTHELPGEGKIEFLLRIQPRTLEVAIGERLEFTDAQLAELAMYYKSTADLMIQALSKAYKAAGLGNSPSDPREHTTTIIRADKPVHGQ